MKILFDGLGGDNSPQEIVKGAILAKNELGIEIAIIGNKEEINKILLEENAEAEVIHADEKIENDEQPAFAIKNKKNSSIVLGLKALAMDKYDAFVSAGSTGALLAGGLFIVKRIPNIKRAVIPTPIPTIKGSVCVIDSGANMDTDPELLLQFAKMGNEYVKTAFSIENPRIGLLNVGTEAGKGNELTKETFKLLANTKLNFVGNVEARDIAFDVCDVLICDGFVGNVLLKTTEGIAGFYNYLLKEKVIKNMSKEGQVEFVKNYEQIKKRLDYKEIGGATLLGLNKIVVKAHGSSNAMAIKNAAKNALDSFNGKIIENMKNCF